MPAPTRVSIEPIPAFHDNYIWLLMRGRRAALVDPGSAAAAQAALDARGLSLESILVTHHHADHVGGVDELTAASGARIFAPAREDIADGACRLRGDDRAPVLDLELQVIDVPGHTAGHIAYYAAELDALFCGDTLFAGGCGRLFEGTPAQMLGSLRTLAALPGRTRVYCAHEYTLANLGFALEVDPDNAALRERQRVCAELRRRGLPTLPSTLDEECATNPFLRVAEPALRAAAERRQPGAGQSDLTTFAALRSWKDGYRAI